MKIPSLIRKLSGLFKLATGQAGTPEGDNARRQMNKMLETQDVKISDEQLEQHEVTVDKLNDMDGDLATIIADMTNTVAYALKTDKGVIRFKGVRVCVLEAERVFVKTSQGLNRMAAYVSLGYLAGSVGVERFQKYIMDAQKAGKTSDILKETLAQSEEESKKFNALDTEPTDQEGKVVVAATLAAEEMKFWESLKNGD
jgi:hypothetical protein